MISRSRRLIGTSVGLLLAWQVGSLCFGAEARLASTHSSQVGSLSWATVLDAAPDPTVIADPAIRLRIAATGLPWRVREASCGIEMLLVPAGTFTMGASAGDMDAVVAEQPAHEVTITKPFYLSRTEVTQQQWVKAMKSNPSRFQESTFRTIAVESREAELQTLLLEGFTRREAQRKLGAERAIIDDTTNFPVDSMSLADLKVFLQKSNLQLPTEAQWEYACRAGSKSPTYGPLDAIAWCGPNSHEHTHPVGTLAANAFGLHDMLGNVWEWCSDRFAVDSFVASKAGVVDPTGPSSGEASVVRGGNWLSLPKTCRSSYRIGAASGVPAYGFRVARNP